MKNKTLVAACSTILLVTGLSMAQSDEAAKAAARELGNEGIAMYEKGDYGPALDRLSRAYQVVKAPTLCLWLARALAKNGKLVEAAERLREVGRFQLTGSSPAQFKEAQDNAAKELEALEKRIPSVIVTVDGADVTQVIVTLNGERLRAAFIGMPVPVNPGPVTVRGELGTTTATEKADLKEGDRGKSIVLKFGAAAVAAEPPAAVPPPPAASTTPAPAAPAALPPPTRAVAPSPAPMAPPPQVDQGAQGPGFLYTTMPWIAIGVGGAGLIAGGVTGAIALSKRKQLDDSGACFQGGICATARQGDVDSYNQMRTASTVGFIVGGVGVAAGITLLLIAPHQPAPAKAAKVEPWVGLGSAGVAGVF